MLGYFPQASECADSGMPQPRHQQVDLPAACINANTECSQFADDTAIIAAHEKFLAAEEHLQSAVTTAAQWLNDWHLLVNESKTTVIHFHHTNRPPPRPPSITLNDTNLTVASRHRHLGLLIQQNLCWNSHVDYIITKATRKVFLLLRLRNSLNTSALSSIYLTYIHPVLEYACTVLSPLPATLSTSNGSPLASVCSSPSLSTEPTPCCCTSSNGHHSAAAVPSPISFLHIACIIDMHHHTFLQFTYPEYNPFARSGSPNL